MQKEDGEKGQRRLGTITDFFHSLPGGSIDKPLKAAQPPALDVEVDTGSKNNADDFPCEGTGIKSSQRIKTKPKERKWSLAWKVSSKGSKSDSDFDEDVKFMLPVDSAKTSKAKGTRKTCKKSRKDSQPNGIISGKEEGTAKLNVVRDECLLCEKTEAVSEIPAEKPALSSEESNTKLELQELSSEDDNIKHISTKSNVFDILMKKKKRKESQECETPSMLLESKQVTDTPGKDSSEDEANHSSEALDDSVILVSETKSEDHQMSNVCDPDNTSREPNVFDVLMKRHKIGHPVEDGSKPAASSSASHVECNLSGTSRGLTKPSKKKSHEFKLCIKMSNKSFDEDLDSGGDEELCQEVETLGRKEKSGRKTGVKRKQRKKLNLEGKRHETSLSMVPSEKDCAKKAEKPERRKGTRGKMSVDGNESDAARHMNFAEKTKKTQRKRTKKAHSQAVDSPKSPESLDFESDPPRMRLRKRAEVLEGECEQVKLKSLTKVEKDRKKKRKTGTSDASPSRSSQDKVKTPG